MISVVIPSYNRKSCVLNLLRDVYAQEEVEFEVIVVDDASPDDTVEAVRREFPQAKLLPNHCNSGPCVSRNRGILAARGELIVGFDSDVTVPDRRLLSKVREAFADSPVASGFAFRILTPDGQTDDAARWWHPVPLARNVERRFETDYFSGTAYAFRREEIVNAGLFPELLYMHYEEVELAWRILDHGGQILYRPQLAVRHHVDPVSRRSEVELFFKPRNQILLAVSCLPWPEALVFLLSRTTLQCGKALSQANFLKFLQAMSSALTLLPHQFALRKPLRRKTLARISKLSKSGAHRLPSGKAAFRLHKNNS